MRFSISDQRYPDGVGAPVLDLTLGAVAPDVTVADLLDLVARRYPETLAGGIGPGGAELDVDGLPVDHDDPITALPIQAGSVLALRSGPARRREPGTGVSAAPVELTQVAGPAAGSVLGLRRGSYLLGRGPVTGLELGRVARPALEIEVGGAADTRITATGAAKVRVDGRDLAADESVRETVRSSVVRIGDTVFRVAPATPADLDRGPTVGLDADPQGRRPLIRTPRVAVPAPPGDVPVPPPPAPPPAPAPPSWLMMLAPLPIGIVMALVFSPFFLLMTAMTPLMGLARWIEGKHRARKEAVRMATESAAAAARFAADLDLARDAIAAAARAAHPDLAELRRRARSGRGLWDVRPGDPDELRIALGIGTVPWRPELGRGADTVRATPALAAALADRAGLVDVPVLVDLRERSGLGIVGPVAVGRRLAAAVLLDLVARHGPADVDLLLLVEPARLPDWDWAKWLPHLADDAGVARVATAAEPAAALLTRLVDEPRPAGRAGFTGVTTRDEARPDGATYTVVVVDGDELLTGRVASLLGRLSRGRGRALVVTARAGALPSVCRSFAEVDADGGAVLTDAASGERIGGLLTARATGPVCAATARALARWTDPERPSAAALLPERVRLVDLLGAIAGPAGPDRPRDADPLDGAAIAGLWRRRPPGLAATVGVTERGPLTVDLLADGPHGLVVGTTGAGKSELLRTLVAALACRYSPDHLSFLLVDFKGGGAFDACAGLPHTVGLVTDLDEHLAGRALRCLRAELRHRERRLREAGVSDLRDYPAPVPPLPRLLIVIDEFATLAAELPGFLSALVDVAQRGRSLGIHLLLATQRPQGVVDGKIRANTNLRMALRVQDDADSRDVLGTRHAADIDRRRPGRGYLRLGAGEILAVQSALVSAPAPRDRAERIELAPFLLVPPAPAGAVPGGAANGAADGPTDLECLVAATAAATELGGYAAPRVPWPAPLPEEVDAWSLPEPPDPGALLAPAALGIVDLPDEQRTDVWWWQPEAGGTLLLGADPAAVGAALAAACLALARGRHPDRQRLLVLDGLGCGLAELAGLPHVTAAVGVDDGERLSRVLDRVDAEVARRRATGTGGPETLLVVAGWSAVVEGAERAGAAGVAERLERLLRDGAQFGVRLLTSAAHERGVPGRVLAQLPVKLCLRLADPTSYTGLGLRAREVPELRGLRAIDVHGRQELHIGGYGGGPGGLAASVARVAARYPDAAPGAGVLVLPEVVPAAEVLGASAVAGTTWRLGVGRYYRDLRVAALALSPGMHVVVAGPAGSGRTSTLRVLARAARDSRPGATVCVVAADPLAWDPAAVTEVAGSFAELTRWPPDGPGLLLVDGLESLGPAAGVALDRLLPAVPAAAHVVVAARADAFRGMQPWQRAVTMSRTGLLLRPGPDDGEVLRVRLPREAPPRPVPGRGYLVEAGGLDQIQVALLPAAAEPAARAAEPAARAAEPAARAAEPAARTGRQIVRVAEPAVRGPARVNRMATPPTGTAFSGGTR